MGRLYCKGKKGFCERVQGTAEECENVSCTGCDFLDGTGAEFVDQITNYDNIRNMSVDEMVKFMNECGHDFPPYCDYKRAETCDQNCFNCAKKWLSQEMDIQ